MARGVGDGGRRLVGAVRLEEREHVAYDVDEDMSMLVMMQMKICRCWL